MMRDISALNREMIAAGVRDFAGGRPMQARFGLRGDLEDELSCCKRPAVRF